MHPGLLAIGLLFAATLAVASCSGDKQPGEYALPTPIFVLGATPEPEYLTDVIPPCTPLEGFVADPCAALEPVTVIDNTSTGFDSTPRDFRYYLGDDSYTPSLASHLVIRATTKPDTIRCAVAEPSHFYPVYTGGATRGGSSPSIHCYIDVRVNEYFFGTGSENLTLLLYDKFTTLDNAEENRRYHEQSVIQSYDSYTDLEAARFSGFGTQPYELIFFIRPSLDASREVWQVGHMWAMLPQDDGTFKVYHPYGPTWASSDPAIFQQYKDTLLEPSLATFRREIIAANQARMTEYGGRIGPGSRTKDLAANAQWPMLISDTNDLRQHYIDVGNFDHPRSTPEMPPAPCAMGAVDNHVDNYGLMQDCSALLYAMVDLGGSLNWATDLAMADWDGISVDSDRVVTVDLEDESLTGTLSRHLGRVAALETLKLAGNSLTGHIPASLADLDLDKLELSGNSLAGCIPAGLRDIDDHDLGSLGLGDCLTPPPDADSSLSFTSSAYTFSVAEDAAVGTAVGAVQASDSNSTRTLTYTIIMGNAAGKFAVGGASGAITVAAELDYGTRQQYTLTLNVNNGAGGNKTTTVTVNVTDAAEDPPTP